MIKTNKLKIFFIVLVMIVIILPLSITNAAETDNGDSQIIRKTTTNYFTTIKIEGVLNNEKTGQTETFTKTSEEIIGNVGNENVAAIIESLKNEFREWAINKNVENNKIEFSNEGIKDYYYDAHDEITQTNLVDSNVILIGDINEIETGYADQGNITIETILDKHQTYIISAVATIEDTEVKNVNITLNAPIVGETVTVITGSDENVGYPQQDNVPEASTSDKITIGATAWVKGTYPEIGDEYMDYISTTFEKDKYYYAMIEIEAKEGYTLSNDLTIKVNGEEPAEVFVVYNNKNTHFIAKIQAVEKVAEVVEEPENKTVTYKILDGEEQTVEIKNKKELTVRADGNIEKFVNLKVDDEVLSKDKYVLKSGSTIATLKVAYLDTLTEGTHKLTFVYNDGEVSTNFKIIKTREETEQNTTNPDNPRTGDDIIITSIIFIISTLASITTTKRVLIQK